MYKNLRGFLLVRKANSMESVEPFNRRFVLGYKEYEGLERGNLYDITPAYYAKELPNELHAVMKKFIESDTQAPLIFQDIDNAKRFLSYCRTKNDFNEIIFVQSAHSGSVPPVSNKDLDWLGYDVISYFYDSLLFLGVFSYPQYFKAWEYNINRHGLLENLQDINDYVVSYLNVAETGFVENYLCAERGFEPISVWKVKA